MIWKVFYDKKFLSESNARTKYDAIADVSSRHPELEDVKLWNALPKFLKPKTKKKATCKHLN